MAKNEIVKREVPTVYKGYLADVTPMDIFEQTTDLESRVYEYLGQCERNKTLPRKSELCIRLNIGIDTFNRWIKFVDMNETPFAELTEFDQKRFLFSLVLKRASDKITSDFEKSLINHNGNPIAKIFYAKARLGWQEGPENQQNTQININISKLDENL